MQLVKPTVRSAHGLFSSSILGASLLLSSQAIAADVAAADESEPAAAVERRDFSRFDYISETLAGWKVVVGAGGMVEPKFEGAKRFEIKPLPLLMAEFGRVSVDPRGVSVKVVEFQNFSFAARGGYDLGRDDSDDRHLRGLGDIDAGGVVGATAAYELGPVKFSVGLDKTIGGSDGLTGTVGAEASHMFGQFILTAGASATWADDNHMEDYFGVTRRQSSRSGLSRYKAEAGVKRVDVEASATYLIDEHWLVRGQAGVGYLVGDAADSPIVQRKAQPSGMLMLGYRF
jgi:outer membrane protein